jgi:DUF1680 family protein
MICPISSAYLETLRCDRQCPLETNVCFLLHGDAKYLDVLERVIYNGFLSGVLSPAIASFYPNPLESDGKTKFNMGILRTSALVWLLLLPSQRCSAFMPEIASFVYATRGNELFVNLFIGGHRSLQFGWHSR